MSEPAFFHLRKPSRRLGQAVPSGGPFSYPDVGATRTTPPSGWTVDRVEEVIGAGEAAFDRAKAAICAYKMFDLSWIDLLRADPLAPGAEVLFASKQLGVWSLNTCRVVYLVDEEDEAERRFGFAYGTLASHAVAGEERFLATLDKASGELRFEVFKFSLPRHPLVKLLAPLARGVQRRFSEDAIEAMRREVSE